MNARNLSCIASGLIRAGAALLIAAAPLLSRAQAPSPNPPGQISYQGFVTDANGVPLANTNPRNYDVVFRIYPTATGAVTPLWGEIQTVTVDKGYFSVMLGQGAALAGENWSANLTSLFTGADASDRFVGITVRGVANPDTEIQPRLRLLASPYSFLAAHANALVSAAGQPVISSSGTPAIATFPNGLSLLNGSLRLNDRALYFRGGNDVNHGLSYGATFPANPDGPALWGLGGGVLGTMSGGARASLIWDTTGARVNGAFSATSFSGPGGGLTALNAANIASGTLPDARLSANVASLNGVQTFSAAKTFGAGAWVAGANVIEFGQGVAGKQNDAGKIGYQTFSADALDVVGAGATQAERKIKFWTEGGFFVAGNGRFENNVGIGPTTPQRRLHVSGSDNVPARLDSSSTIGTWLALGNSSVGGNFWHMINTGSANGEGVGKLLFGAGASDGGSTIRVTFQPDGKVGIGTHNPQAPLEISGFANLTRSYGFLNSAGTVGTAPNQTVPYSLIASHRIGATEFNAFSDRRIKDVIGPSNTRADLETVQQLKITDYRMIDNVANGSGLRKGLVAQEVQKIIPEAVTSSRGFVPDIFAKASAMQFDAEKKALRIGLSKAHQLKAGDRVRLFAGESNIETAVLAVVSEREFVVGEIEGRPETLFVYGKQVDDFLAVDYNRIFTAGVGAIQELAKKVETLEANQARRAELEKKAARLEALEDELAALKKAVARIAAAQGVEPRQTASADR